MALRLSPLSRRALWAGPYAQRRFQTEAAHLLAAPHYALVGEARGYRPNGFFAPALYREAAGLGAGAGGLIDHYLGRSDFAVPPSPQFDAEWYADQNPGWRRTHPHPFLHFLETGLAAGLRPRPDVDMGFVRDVVRGKGRSVEEAAMRIFDPKPRDSDMAPPLSRDELKARQDRFYADTRMRIEREPARTERKRLVFVQCARGFDAAYLDEPRSYDVMLNAYEESPPNPKADAFLVQGGTKTTAIRRLIEDRPEFLMRYDAVLFLDDDVEISGSGVEALFAIAAREDLDVAQPSLTADSDSAWPFLKQPLAGSNILRVSTIEIMAPLMTRRAIETLGWTFAESVSGWGTDLLLGPAARKAFGPASVGVIGATTVRHARAVDTAGGAFYRYLRRYGLDPAHEANRIVVDFGVERHLRLLEPGEAGPSL